jgi:uncharacterized cupredoxin-like copper-binding protein
MSIAVCSVRSTERWRQKVKGMRRTLVLGATLVMAVALVACGSSSGSKGSSGSSGSSNDSSGGVSTGSTATGTPVSVDLGDTNGTNAPMTMTLTPSTVPAGKVTFTVKNDGTIKHEMVVLKATPAELVVGSDGKVSESTTAGEVGDVEVGKTKTGTLNLAAGTYEVVCNIKDHYQLGMHATLTVT